MDRIRILFVDDEAIVREGLKKCIDWEVNGFEVVGAAENGEKALAYLGQLSVNIVVTESKCLLWMVWNSFETAEKVDMILNF